MIQNNIKEILIKALQDTNYKIEVKDNDGIFIPELNVLITQSLVNPDPYPCKGCGQDAASCCGCEKEKKWQEKNKGEWIIVDDCENFIAKCNKCNKIIDSRCLKPKCPYCGRKMINYV